MSLNRQTKAYQKRVKALASALWYPRVVWPESGPARLETIADTIARCEPNVPRYLIDDALALYIADRKRWLASAISSIAARTEELEAAEAAVAEYLAPRRLRVVGGRAA